MKQEEPKVTIVDSSGLPLGECDKLEAHRTGTLHSAISVFIFDRDGRWLLQKRTAHKYHSPSLWSNACCSHPAPDEAPATAAERRLEQELGITCSLHPAFMFTYRHEMPNGLTENEYDHVFFGDFNGAPAPDPTEVEDWKWVALHELQCNVEQHPEQYTYWFRELIERVKRRKQNRHKSD